ncbi:MAG: MerR family transcriptional regulator [Acidimicrobiia bacterium]
MATMSDRDYRSIGEVLTLLTDEFPDITISKIRFLESQGLIDPERTPAGYRKFYENDVERLRFILREQKDHFLPLKVIKDRLGDDEDRIDVTDPIGVEIAGETSAEPMGVTSGASVVATVGGTSSSGTNGSGPDASHHPSRHVPSSGDRVPAWMSDPRVQQRSGRSADGAGTNNVAPIGSIGATGASLTLDDLAEASGLTPETVQELERFGLIQGKVAGRFTYYDEEALVVARLAATFARHGVEARHLRMYKNAAEKEAALFEQLVMPMVKQRNPQSRAQATAMLAQLEELGARMRSAMMRHALRGYSELS